MWYTQTDHWCISLVLIQYGDSPPPFLWNGGFVVSGSLLTGKLAILSYFYYLFEFVYRPPTPPPQYWFCLTSMKLSNHAFFPCCLKDHCYLTPTTRYCPVFFDCSQLVSQRSVNKQDKGESTLMCSYYIVNLHYLNIHNNL